MDPDFRLTPSLDLFVSLSHCDALSVCATKKGVSLPDAQPLFTKVDNGSSWLNKIRMHFETYKINTGKILADGKVKINPYLQVDKKEFTSVLFKLSDELVAVQAKVFEEKCSFLRKVDEELKGHRFSLVEPFLSVVNECKGEMIQGLAEGENLLFETLDSLLVPTKRQLRESIDQIFTNAQQILTHANGKITEKVFFKMKKALLERATVLSCEIKNTNGRFIIEKSEQGFVVRSDIPLDAFPAEKAEVTIGSGEKKLRCVFAKKENKLLVKLASLPIMRGEKKVEFTAACTQETEKKRELKSENNVLVNEILALLNTNEGNLYQILNLLKNSNVDRTQKKDIYLILISAIKNLDIPNKEYFLYLLLKNAWNDPKLHYYSVFRIRNYLSGHYGVDFVWLPTHAGPACELLKKYKTPAFSKGLCEVTTLDVSQLSETDEQRRIQALETENMKLKIFQRVMSKTQGVVSGKLTAKWDEKRNDSK